MIYRYLVVEIEGKETRLVKLFKGEDKELVENEAMQYGATLQAKYPGITKYWTWRK
ncbi:MAG: hypothetical protein HQM12_24195, partial [SAR324 cluster bacterium]|nr:hypothetical protein [SAR324 cluster bacterium]